MNKQLMSILLILSFPLTSFAAPSQQGDLNLPSEKGSKIERLTNDLGLNEAEKAKVEAIINEEKGKFKAIREEKRTRLQGVLTKDQMTKFDQIPQQRHHKPSTTGEGGTNQ